RAGGPRGKGRPAASRKQWTEICELVKARAGWRCQACGLRTKLDVHHVVKRAHGGSDVDLDNLVALCRGCHDQTDAPFVKGRLVVMAMGRGVFTFDHIYAASKWDARRANALELLEAVFGTRSWTAIASMPSDQLRAGLTEIKRPFEPDAGADGRGGMSPEEAERV